MITYRSIGLLGKPAETAKKLFTGLFLLVSLLLLVGGVVFLNGCSRLVVSGTVGQSSHYPAQAEVQKRPVSIPPGHMPPAGKCRIWFPGLPPGQQPPPGNCNQLRYHVPQGAELVRG